MAGATRLPLTKRSTLPCGTPRRPPAARTGDYMTMQTLNEIIASNPAGEDGLRRHWMYEAISRKISAVQSGDIAAVEISGSTSERLAVGLALDCLLEMDRYFDQVEAWNRLNSAQQLAVRDHNAEYRAPRWDRPIRYI